MRNKLLIAIIGSLFVANQAAAAIKIWLPSPIYNFICILIGIAIGIAGVVGFIGFIISIFDAFNKNEGE